MGTWGVGNFENDFAMDWISELQSRKDLVPILVAFSKIDEGVIRKCMIALML